MTSAFYKYKNFIVALDRGWCEVEEGKSDIFK